MFFVLGYTRCGLPLILLQGALIMIVFDLRKITSIVPIEKPFPQLLLKPERQDLFIAAFVLSRARVMVA